MGQDDAVTISAPALGALAARLRAAGFAIGDARDRHAGATREAVDPVAQAHLDTVARWTSGLRAAAAATVEAGNEIDRYARATRSAQDVADVAFHGLPAGPDR